MVPEPAPACLDQILRTGRLADDAADGALVRLPFRIMSRLMRCVGAPMVPVVVISWPRVI